MKSDTMVKITSFNYGIIMFPVGDERVRPIYLVPRRFDKAQERVRSDGGDME
jgi:hypothetical protein